MNAADGFMTVKGDAPYLIVCDHASNFIPPIYQDLGLPKLELERHIAWDIGAANVAERLAQRFGCSAILAPVSRLVIDLNRHPHDPTLIPEVSDMTAIPGNRNLDRAEKQARLERYHGPYHAAIAAELDRRMRAGRPPIFLSIHSMTPQLRGQRRRPWQITICWHNDRRLSDPLFEALRDLPQLVVGDNMPYALDPDEDFTVPVHAVRRGLPHILVEFRQDLIEREDRALYWADLFEGALRRAFAAAGL